VPRLADHGRRREEILAALLRVAATRGLHAASMRTVAAEAGVTVSTVQYYFGTKEELLLAGLQHLAEAVGRRAAAAIRSAGAGSTRATVQAWVEQLIPSDAEQRASFAVFAAYAALAATDPALAELPYTRNTAELERALSGLLAAARSAGEVDASGDPAAEAANLLALATGLGDSVMAGMRTSEAAHELLCYHLGRLFPPRRSPPERSSELR
jgi:AcrR family transcriptional regulator